MLISLYIYDRSPLLFKTVSDDIPGSIHTSDFIFNFFFFFYSFSSLIGTDIFDLHLKGKKLQLHP